MTTPPERALFPALRELAYLNAGTFGPLATPTVDAIVREQLHDLQRGRYGMPWFEEVMGVRATLRQLLATLVGAAPEQLALTSSTTDGCNIVVAGLGIRAGDEIVTTTDEHFGLLGPLGVSPADVVVVPPDPDRIAAAVTPRTKLIAVSNVLWTTGATLPVRELREQTGVPVLVDGAQSVGAVPVDVAGLDFLTISGQKWLCGPDATGALYVADPDGLAVTRPGYLSQSSHGPDGTFAPRPGAQRFEPNWIGAPTLHGLRAALDVPPPDAYALAAAATRRCRELLAAKTEVLPGDATLVTFRPEGDPATLVARLADAGVVVRDIPGRGVVRASCAWWTNGADLERLVAAL